MNMQVGEYNDFGFVSKKGKFHLWGESKSQFNRNDQKEKSSPSHQQKKYLDRLPPDAREALATLDRLSKPIKGVKPKTPDTSRKYLPKARNSPGIRFCLLSEEVFTVVFIQTDSSTSNWME